MAIKFLTSVTFDGKFYTIPGTIASFHRQFERIDRVSDPVGYLVSVLVKLYASTEAYNAMVATINDTSFVTVPMTFSVMEEELNSNLFTLIYAKLKAQYPPLAETPDVPVCEDC